MEDIRKLIINKYKYDCDGSEYEDIVSEAKLLLEKVINHTDLDTLEKISGHLAKPYLAIEKLQQELSIANDKLKKIDKYCESTKEKYKYYNECNTTDVRVISKIIKGEWIMKTITFKELKQKKEKKVCGLQLKITKA